MRLDGLACPDNPLEVHPLPLHTSSSFRRADHTPACAAFGPIFILGSMKRARGGKKRDFQPLRTLYPREDEPDRANRQDCLGQDFKNESCAKAEEARQSSMCIITRLGHPI